MPEKNVQKEVASAGALKGKNLSDNIKIDDNVTSAEGNDVSRAYTLEDKMPAEIEKVALADPVAGEQTEARKTNTPVSCKTTSEVIKNDDDKKTKTINNDNETLTRR